MHLPTRVPVARMSSRHPPSQWQQLRTAERREKVLCTLAVLVLISPIFIYLAANRIFYPRHAHNSRPGSGAAAERQQPGEQLDGQALQQHPQQWQSSGGLGGAGPATQPPAPPPAGWEPEPCPAFRPTAHGQLSDEWRPSIRPLCCNASASSHHAGGTPAVLARAAACKGVQGLPPTVFGGEALTYPGFRARLPSTVQQGALDGLLAHLRDACIPVEMEAGAQWSHWPPAQGLTLRHTSVLLTPPLATAGGGVAPSDACWLGGGAHPAMALLHEKRPALAAALLLGWGLHAGGGSTASSSQWSRLAQAAHAVTPGTTTYLLASRPEAGPQAQQWQLFQETALDYVRPLSEPAVAVHLVHPCRVPSHHPYLSLRPVEEVYSRAGASRLAAPGRRAAAGSGAGDIGVGPPTVVWLTDAASEPAAASGEAQLQQAVRSWLEGRARGEELRVVPVAAPGGGNASGGWPFDSMHDALRFFSSQAVALVGSGAALVAAGQWAPVGTPVLQLACTHHEPQLTGAAPAAPSAAAEAALAARAWLQSTAIGHDHWLLVGECLEQASQAAGVGGVNPSVPPLSSSLVPQLVPDTLLAALNASMIKWNADPQTFLRPYL